ncbi:E3 ubiquitin-protein ligase TRAF7 isoform X2 [Strongylocentrotus purpuratus]|uniref:E3 ubiquitin-protein ligase TRAF7 n=1 Tax=Strongylocentrotus purpuratus TaxID=7668 RepID=A0A7M7HLA4_STRPU|nr:E3 ubiquitin-protein ligase TRAF7 isoform X2 [Strongylocentrotus purpuratus]|eukprot:XP_011670541.1 PREDICTED: E3 ubiquitin-protein ligase TRAF7 isoform X2 [Strongylocentrotus purpuratus]
MTSNVVFVEEPSSHLLCPVCKNLLLEPMISVECGHTFCKACLQNTGEGVASLAECPVDSKPLKGTRSVPNRSIESQIDELQIFCKCGIKRLDSRNDVVEDETGCPEIIPLASQTSHEEECSFVKVVCPNSALCGKVPRSKLEDHFQECQHFPCDFTERGCSFRGTKQAVEDHIKSCTCQLTSESIPSVVLELQKENIELKTQVEALNHKLAVVEQSHESLLTHMKKLEVQMQAVTEKLNDTNGLRSSSSPGYDSYPPSRTPSTRSMRLSRSGSAGSISGLRNSMEFIISQSPRSDSWQIPFEFKCIGTLMGHSNAINCIAINGHKVYSSGGDFHIKVWDIEKLSKGCIQTMQGHTNTVQVLVASSDFLYSAGDDRTIRMWRYNTAGTEFKCRNDAHAKSISAMIKVEGHIFTSSHSFIKVWTAESLELIHTISGLHHWVRALAVDSKMERLYSGSHNSLSVWDTKPPFALKRKLDHTYGSIYSIAITHQYILLGTYNQNVKIIEVDTFTPKSSLSGHIGTVSAISSSPDGRFAITSCYDGKARIFNLENFLSLQVLSRHQGSINAISLRNGLLFTGSEDKDIKIFKYFKAITYSSYGIHITPGKDT